MRIVGLVWAAGLVACGGVDIEGNVYELDIDDMDITGADPDLAAVMGLFFNSPVLLQTNEASADGFSPLMAYGVADEDAQDECTGTTELPSATMDDVAFALGPETTDVLTTRTSFTIEGLEAAGTFSEEYDAMATLTIAGVVDLRQAVGFAGITSADGACDTFEGLGLPCAACGDSQPYCVDLELTNLSAARVDIPVVAITTAEADANCLEE